MNVSDTILLRRPCPNCGHRISAWRTYKPENFKTLECPDCQQALSVVRGPRAIPILLIAIGIPIYTNDAIADEVKAAIFAVQLAIAFAGEMMTRFAIDRSPVRASIQDDR